ncbi:MAG TPA: DUF2252 domain-containing protein [Actinomycetota bacterium]|nr:DUF2252 domain-containing protein [Actinomycetota bacterium]
MTAARAEAGRALRRTVPRSSHAAWDPGGRRSALRLLDQTNRLRLPDLVPIRDARMAASPFAFLRGTPAVMAADLSTTPVTGIPVQACGDAHLLNFGLFATPERNLIFGLNDFDETLPGPWEWDVKRLAVSFVVAARTVGLGQPQGRRAALAAVRTYREQLARFAGMRLLEVWYSRVDASTIVALSRGRQRREVVERLARAEHHTNLEALPRLTEPVDGGRRFVENPPLLTHVAECDDAWVEEVLARYRSSLQNNRRQLLRRFRPVDAARKVVGVGSVGTRCYVVLLLGDRHDDPLLLQVKQATASVLEPYVGRSRHRHYGQRVVNGQRLLQAASDIFLGWTGDGAAHYYVRQLWDMKGSVDLEAMLPDDLVAYGRLCGWVLARAHARSGDAVAISGYLGSSNRFDRAVATFAEAYADQTETDYAAFLRARGSPSGQRGRVGGTNQRKGAEG